MPEATNRMNLPEPLVKAISHHEFVNVPGSISRHRLEEPPQLVFLRREHHVQRDVSDMIWSSLQQALSTLMRSADGTEADAKAREERSETITVLKSRLNKVVSIGTSTYQEELEKHTASGGAADRLEYSRHLSQLLDEKKFLEQKIEHLERKNAFLNKESGSRFMMNETMVAEMAIHLPKVLSQNELSQGEREWEVRKVHDVIDLYDKETGHVYLCRICRTSQVKKASFVGSLTREANVQAWLLRKNGYPVNSMSILFMFKDYSEAQKKRMADYPAAQVMIRPVNISPEKDVEGHVYSRLYKHALYDRGYYIKCEDGDMWKDMDTYDVMYAGTAGKAATRKAHKRGIMTIEEANEIIQKRTGFGGPEKLYVQVVPGERHRCSSYCPVAGICKQNQELTAKEIEMSKEISQRQDSVLE
jgi:hypothetical protein